MILKKKNTIVNFMKRLSESLNRKYENNALHVHRLSILGVWVLSFFLIEVVEFHCF